MVINNLESIHNTNLIIGEAFVLDDLKSDFEKLGVLTIGNPDFISFSLEVFGIDDAKVLQEWLLLLPLRDKKFCIIFTKSITVEAQNALLKSFEDMLQNTHVYLIVRNSNLILTTLKSRMINLGMYTSAKGRLSFWDKDMKYRLITIREKNKDDKSSLDEFVQEAQFCYGVNRDKNIIQLERILLANKYSQQKGVSVKMVLEWLAYYI